MRLQDVVARVGGAVSQVDFKSYGFAIEQIDLSLKTTSVIEGGIKVDLDVVQLGTTVKATDVRSVTLSLVPHSQRVSFVMDGLLQNLVAGVKDAAEGLRQAAKSLPDYGLKTATIEIAFAINANGGFEVVVSASGDRETEQGLKLTVTHL